jgi:Putative DNA-binding domain
VIDLGRAPEEAKTTLPPEPMKYVEWVQRVLQATEELTRADSQARLVGVPWDRVLGRLGGPSDASSPAFHESPEFEALADAVKDLDRLGLVEPGSVGSLSVRLTQKGRRLAVQSLRSIWPQVFAIYLDDEQLAFLRQATALSEDRQVGYARVEWVPWQKVFDALDWRSDHARAYDIAARLEEEGCLVRMATLGDRIEVYSTYAGILRATEQVQTELQQLVAGLLPEWETTNVEFKRQLDLATKADKAEFIRDILALATTKSSGERFLIVGFDDKTHQSIQSVDPVIDQNRLEHILNAYAAPAPWIRYHRVTWDQGEIGVIKVLRDPSMVPYRVTKTLAHISQGDVYVRHGSQVEPPTPAELTALEAEGRAATSATH